MWIDKEKTYKSKTAGIHRGSIELMMENWNEFSSISWHEVRYKMTELEIFNEICQRKA